MSECFWCLAVVRGGSLLVVLVGGSCLSECPCVYVCVRVVRVPV